MLNPGTFAISDDGIVMKSGVVLRGSGADKTQLVFTMVNPCGGGFSAICFSQEQRLVRAGQHPTRWRERRGLDRRLRPAFESDHPGQRGELRDSGRSNHLPRSAQRDERRRRLLFVQACGRDPELLARSRARNRRTRLEQRGPESGADRQGHGDQGEHVHDLSRPLLTELEEQLVARRLVGVGRDRERRPRGSDGRRHELRRKREPHDVRRRQRLGARRPLGPDLHLRARPHHGEPGRGTAPSRTTTSTAPRVSPKTMASSRMSRRTC